MEEPSDHTLLHTHDRAPGTSPAWADHVRRCLRLEAQRRRTSLLRHRSLTRRSAARRRIRRARG